MTTRETPRSHWSVLRLARRLRGGGRRGQTAVMFIVLMALVFLLAMVTMNLGEVARLKTATAKATDAGALAGASWVASGVNETAMIAAAMLLNVMIVQAIFLVPFCPDIVAAWFFLCTIPLKVYLALYSVNHTLKLVADMVLENAWERGKASALFTAIQNTLIDDPTDTVRDQIQALSEEFDRDEKARTFARFDWVRKGARGVEEPSWVEIHVDVGEKPDLKMDGWAPTFICWTACYTYFPFGGVMEECCMTIPTNYGPQCVWWCWRAPGWNEWEEVEVPDAGSLMGKTVMRFPNWFSLFGFDLWPGFGSCQTCFPTFWPLGALFEVSPSEIANDEGDITVSVTQHREGGANLRFWTTRYPDQIASQARAHYYGTEFGSRDAYAQLEAILK